MNSAERIHKTIAPLWPLLDAESFAVDIGSVAWIEDAAGVCVDIDNEALVDRYVASTAPDHPAQRLLHGRPVGLRFVLVVDYESASRGGGFNRALKIVLHEFAHAVREDLANGGFYPWATRVVEINRYLQKRFSATEGQPEHEHIPSPQFLALEDVQVIQDFMYRFEDQPETKPLFGEWAVASDQCDVGHDLLFYLLLYLLEREEADSEAFKTTATLEPSVYFPK
jgi:hypothetical protein